MRIEDIEREIDPLKNNHTKCTKMTDESDSIKNGINGAPTNLTTSIHVSRGNALSGSGIYGSSNNNNGLQSSISVATASINFKEERDDGRLTHDHKGYKLNNDVGGSTLINNGSDLRSPHHQGIGGRLQFFKDGKFILELARAREGEKGGWVSVPRKTYWPPSASSTNTTTTNYSKNESSASLSFSDDNSSIQSSPWQRDHCWKQTNPRKCISREMCMLFKRTKNMKISRDGFKIARIKRRRPYDTVTCKMPFTLLENGFINRFSHDLIEVTKIKQEKIENDSSSTESETDCRNKKTVDEKNKKCKSQSQAKLTAILQKLIDRLPSGVFSLPKTAHISGTINHFSSTSSRIADLHHHQHVSPRKRILRELEKVTLEDNKRSRAKANSAMSLSPLITTPVSVNHSIQKSNNNVNAQISSSNNENSSDQNTTSVSNSTRLYSSYSIHSLLGHTNSSINIKTEPTEVNNSSKESSDPSYLRNVLSSPKSPENGNKNSLATSSTSMTNNRKKSPSYTSLQEAHHRQNRSPSSEILVNYGRVRSPEIQNRSPDNSMSSRYKQFSSSTGSNTTSSGFHPYLASPKYSSSSNLSPNPSTDSYKFKSVCTSNSPNHTRNVGCSRSPSAFSPSPQNSKISSFHSPTSTNNSSNRLREASPSEAASPGPDRREAIPRTVPKKTVALRQQFSSPVSSPSVTQGDTSSTYKSGIDQKRKNIEERTLSPENAIYHSGVDMEHVTAGVLRSSPVLPHSSLFYLYPPHGSPGSHTASSYIPPVSYYHPYAAAVAALRNPLWMHYQAGVMSSVGAVQPRLPTAIFPYNGAAAGVSPSSMPTPLSSMHLSPATINPWSPLGRESSSTEDPVSLVSIKDEHSSDVPLNLSKH